MRRESGRPLTKAEREQIGRHNELVEKIRPLLAGQDFTLQGSVLAELAAIYMAGYQTPELRAGAYRLFMEAVAEMLPIAIEEAAMETSKPN
jgi:hypothetical protein